jgi:hypothetical protein
MNKWLIIIIGIVLLISCKSKSAKQSGNQDYKSLCTATKFDSFQDATQSIQFFPQLDTFYFIPNLAPYDSIKIAVNCLNIYDKNCWNTYKGEEILLTNRSIEPNGWADGPFTNYIPEFVGDFIEIQPFAKRNNLRKLNVVRFQFFKGDKHFEQVYHIGVGIEQPSNAIVVIDYEDLNQMVGPKGNYANGAGFEGFCEPLNQKVAIGANYIVQTNKVPEYRCSGMTRCFIEKPVLFSLYDIVGNLTIQQHVGSSLSCNGSAHYPAKGLQVVARGHYGEKKMKAAFFESEEKYENMRIRLGGTGQFSFPCQHTMDPIAHDMYENRGLKSKFVSVYINGVEWGVGYMQEKLDEHYVEKYYGVDEQFVDVIEIIGQKEKGIICQDSTNSRQLHEKGLLDKLGYHEYLSYDDNFCWLAAVKDGNGKAFSDFYKALMQGDFSKLNVESLWDYLVQVDFLTIEDMGRNNTIFFCTDRRNPEWYVQGMDFDHAFKSDPTIDHWLYLLNPKDQDPFRNIVRKYFEISDNRTMFIKRYQDLLNTRYHLKRIIPIINQRLNEFALEVENHEYAWQPNALDAKKWLSRCYEQPYLQEWMLNRHYASRQHIANLFMGEMGFKVENLVKITLVYPKDVPLGKDFYIQFNTLKITNDYDGLYFPFPSVDISLHNVPKNYEFVGWKGFNDSKATKIQINSTKDLVIEPIFRKK